jgi:hypothetical protein
LEEVLDEMVHRGYLAEEGDAWRLLAEDAEA